MANAKRRLTLLTTSAKPTLISLRQRATTLLLFGCQVPGSTGKGSGPLPASLLSQMLLSGVLFCGVLFCGVLLGGFTGAAAAEAKAGQSRLRLRASCPLVVPPQDAELQPLRLHPSQVAGKNARGCLSPADAIYAADGCPERLCDRNAGVIQLPPLP